GSGAAAAQRGRAGPSPIGLQAHRAVDAGARREVVADPLARAGAGAPDGRAAALAGSCAGQGACPAAAARATARLGTLHFTAVHTSVTVSGFGVFPSMSVKPYS